MSKHTIQEKNKNKNKVKKCEQNKNKIKNNYKNKNQKQNKNKNKYKNEARTRQTFRLFNNKCEVVSLDLLVTEKFNAPHVSSQISLEFHR